MSGGTEIGKAWVQIVPSADGISGSIQRLMDPEAAAAGVSAGGKLVGSIKKMIIGAGIGAALKKTLDIGAELQQNLGGTEAVFGDFAGKIQSTAAQAYKNMGLSASDYMATANKMGSLFQGSGLSQVKSLELTTAAMQRAADVASVMGIDTQWAMDSIANAAKGNFTMMDNLGVKMDATTLQAYALEKGINFKWDTASNAEKAELAMKMFMERTSQYADNFAKESEDTLSGSIGAVKAAAQDLMGNLVLGENVGPAMNNLVETAVTAASNLIPAIGNVLSGLPAAVVTAVDAIHPALMEGLATATESIKANFPQMLEGALTGLLNFSEKIRANAGQLIDAGLTLIKSLADGIIQNIPTFIQTIPTIISNFAGVINDNAPKVLATGLSIIKSLAAGLIQAIPVLVQNIPQILKAIWDVFTAFQWLSLGKTVITAITNGVKAMGTSLSNILKSLGKKAIDAFKGVSWGSVGKTAVNLIVKAITGLASLPATALKKAASLGMKAFTSVAWGNVGSNIVKGIAKGITAGLSVIVNAAKSAAKKALDAAKSALGISSPSKVFKDQVGKNIALGWAAGIDKNASLVTKAVSGIDSAITDASAQPIDYSAAAGSAGGLISGEAAGGTNRNVTINNYITVDGSDSPEEFADRLVRRMQLDMRTA